jgi:hypothetical protein
MGVSKLIDPVAFWNSYCVPRTHLSGRPDTRRSFRPQKRAGKRTGLLKKSDLCGRLLADFLFRHFG